ncbi:14-3-3 protein gamma-2-like [Aphis gossypii]|uniref:14-3-3 protein gamma-2-like n=1 Tax=Aphis gossypii TaxID=80765 RepID=UPI002159A620|nr:14-3-3 protein gamma-2-like [Aphis gossypii]
MPRYTQGAHDQGRGQDAGSGTQALDEHETVVQADADDDRATWKAAMARHYRARVDRELCALYTDLLNVVDWRMRPNWRRASDPATDVFYWKLRADYNRYKAEIIDDPGERAVMLALSRNSYDWGERIGRSGSSSYSTTPCSCTKCASSASRASTWPSARTTKPWPRPTSSTILCTTTRSSSCRTSATT